MTIISGIIVLTAILIYFADKKMNYRLCSFLNLFALINFSYTNLSKFLNMQFFLVLTKRWSFIQLLG